MARAWQTAGVGGIVVVLWLAVSVLPRLEDALRAVGGPQSCPAAVDRLAGTVRELGEQVKQLRAEMERRP